MKRPFMVTLLIANFLCALVQGLRTVLFLSYGYWLHALLTVVIGLLNLTAVWMLGRGLRIEEWGPFAPAGTRRKFLGCRFFEKQVVSPDDPAGPLLVRWILFRAPFLGCYLHKLNRSDHDRAKHDHPWDFITVALRRGYTECYEVTDTLSHNCACSHSVIVHRLLTGRCTEPECLCLGFEHPVKEAFLFHRPLVPFFRPAEWRHRVIIHGKPAWTLVFVFRRRRAWGFWTDKGWCWWRKYDANRGICEDAILHTGGSD